MGRRIEKKSNPYVFGKTLISKTVIWTQEKEFHDEVLYN